MIRILESGNLFNLSIANNIARAVFPRPVGRTTNVLLFIAVFRMFSWYNLGVKFLTSNMLLKRANDLNKLLLMKDEC